MFTENTLYCLNFTYVTQWCRGTMYIDIIYLFWLHSRILKREFHHIAGASSFRMGGRDMMGICRHAAAYEFSIYFSPAAFGMLVFFEYNGSCSFAKDETVPV